MWEAALRHLKGKRSLRISNRTGDTSSAGTDQVKVTFNVDGSVIYYPLFILHFAFWMLHPESFCPARRVAILVACPLILTHPAKWRRYG